jgi:DNA-binding SARP family transcriptional activator
MPLTSIRLFGNFSLSRENASVSQFPSGKLQDLLCYLLVHHDRKLPRELVASTFWENTTTAQSKKYLRTTLWQLRTAIEASFGTAEALDVNDNFVCMKTSAQLWLDVAQFEHAYACVSRTPASCLDNQSVAMMKAGVDLVSGELLPAIYHDWCLSERERLQNSYLAMLDKLLTRCEMDHDFDCARHYGLLLLYHNPMCELTYQHLLRIYNAMGDRGGALALYEKCVATLGKHLGVGPSIVTVKLAREIRSESPPGPIIPLSLPDPLALNADRYAHLRQVQSILQELQEQVRSELSALSKAANPRETGA